MASVHRCSWARYLVKELVQASLVLRQGDIINGNITEHQSHAEFNLISGIFEAGLVRGHARVALVVRRPCGLQGPLPQQSLRQYAAPASHSADPNLRRCAGSRSPRLPCAGQPLPVGAAADGPPQAGHPAVLLLLIAAPTQLEAGGTGYYRNVWPQWLP